jgi:ABC-type multidrug transport system ATPase subunit
MQPSTVLATRGLSKRYGTVQTVAGLDLEVGRGEVFGFLGPNGAGKTTTIRMPLGLVRPTAGRVELFGRDLAAHGDEVLPRVGALVDAPAFYPYLSGRDNLRAVASVLGGVPAGSTRCWSRWTDAVQPAVVVGLWLLALLALSRRLVRRRDILE